MKGKELVLVFGEVREKREVVFGMVPLTREGTKTGDVMPPVVAGRFPKPIMIFGSSFSSLDDLEVIGVFSTDFARKGNVRVGLGPKPMNLLTAVGVEGERVW